MGYGRPLVLLDVDGVLNLGRFSTSRQRSRAKGRDGWYNGRVNGNPYEDRIFLNRRWGRMLLPLAEKAELAWATTWMAEANWYIGPLLGLPELRYAPAPYGSKAVHAVAFTEGRPWAWLDDTAEELDMASALSRGRPHLPVLVDRATGLTQEHVDRVAEWLGGL